MVLRNVPFPHRNTCNPTSAARSLKIGDLASEVKKNKSYLSGSIGAQRSFVAELFFDVIAKNGKSQRRLVGRSFYHLRQVGRQHERHRLFVNSARLWWVCLTRKFGLSCFAFGVAVNTIITT